VLTFLAQYADVFGPLRLFEFITFRALGAAATALFLGLLIAPWLFARLRRLKMAQQLREAGEVGRLADLHAVKKNTPTMGGLQLFIAVVVSAVLWASPLVRPPAGAEPFLNYYLLTALFVYTGLTLIGFLDDYLKVSKKNSKGLNGRLKLLGQAVLTAGALWLLLGNPHTQASMSELWVPFFKEAVWTAMPLWFAFVFFFLVLAGSSNAINLTDGVDGLAIGCTITVALVYGIFAYVTGNAIIADYLLIASQAVVCAALVGSAMAFLWYNSHPATVFMGDTGSLALGGLIGAIAFMVHQPLTLIIVGGIFVMEAASVILQVGSFKLRGKRVFRMAPLHHHFELKGWHESKVVIRFWILSLIFAISGLATLKLR